MFAVRYAALAALVIWVGGLIVLSLVVSLSASRDSLLAIVQPFELVAVACGAVLLISLFTMKFVGPPPDGFLVRAAIALVMLGISAYVLVRAIHDVPTVLTSINIVLGLVLLSWYVRDRS